MIAGQLSPSAPLAAGGRNNPTILGYELAFTMTPQDVAAVCQPSIKKIETSRRIGSISFVIWT
ncbi:hypothetical protein BF49_1529 [Bradyrhizobium sp.]|uniref:hypothetical protein n=1 Tax=Bradyrhizobium sp. TaxID=376 RepID=UPI0007C19917|nr:hypothetical protein [Bradyrhizobium sp.]CUT10449.1 hypothetical protein BF49_1529 [Bradyrhizobium sp.]